MDTGLPNCELLICNKVKYDPIMKIWPCQLCNFARSKYKWKHVIYHANNKHNINYDPSLYTTNNRGAHIELPNDITLQMEVAYGGN